MMLLYSVVNVLGGVNIVMDNFVSVNLFSVVMIFVWYLW